MLTPSHKTTSSGGKITKLTYGNVYMSHEDNQAIDGLRVTLKDYGVYSPEYNILIYGINYALGCWHAPI